MLTSQSSRSVVVIRFSKSSPDAKANREGDSPHSRRMRDLYLESQVPKWQLRSVRSSEQAKSPTAYQVTRIIANPFDREDERAGCKEQSDEADAAIMNHVQANVTGTWDGLTLSGARVSVSCCRISFA